MDILRQRSGGTTDQLLQQRFIGKILREEAAEIDQAQRKMMASRGFTSRDTINGRTFSVTDTVLQYQHLKKHRYIDMSRRMVQGDSKKKVAHPIHNRILFGFANNIVRRLSFEYTDRMRDMLMQDFPQEI